MLPTLAATTPTVAAARAAGELAVSPQHTFFANYFGLPAVTVPWSTATGRLPCGMQFVGPHHDEALVAQSRRTHVDTFWSRILIH